MMSLWQKIRYAFYLSLCVEQIKTISPNHAQYAEAFCMENFDLLVRNRNEGYSVETAVGVMCMMLLDSPDKKMQSAKGLGGLNLIIASDYAMASMARWPSAGINSSYEDALKNFGKYMQTLPV